MVAVAMHPRTTIAMMLVGASAIRIHGGSICDVFMRDFDLPRGPEREIVHDARERGYTLRGSETRALSTVGAFRVVTARDHRNHPGGPAYPRSNEQIHFPDVRIGLFGVRLYARTF